MWSLETSVWQRLAPKLQNFSLTYNQQMIILDINGKYVSRAESSEGRKTLDFAKRLI